VALKKKLKNEVEKYQSVESELKEKDTRIQGLIGKHEELIAQLQQKDLALQKLMLDIDSRKNEMEKLKMVISISFDVVYFISHVNV
jgi:chromosome segregation ATPase